jgi:UrcA family protein
MSAFTIVWMAAAITVMPTSQGGPQQAKVYHGDLDLTTQAGRNTLDRRLSRAVDLVCNRHEVTSTLQQNRYVRKCRKISLSAVKPQRDLAIANGGIKLASK